MPLRDQSIRNANRFCRLIILGFFLVAGCQPGLTDPEAPPEVPPSAVAESSPSQGAITQMPPSPSTPMASGLESLIKKAKEDLAQRLSISVTQINLVEAMEAEWSDSSLDCPQPGMDYLQVITPGYRILLKASGQTYEYHSNRDAYVIYCENSNPPGLPKP
ncbi:MAG TPA: hypothetical protein VJM08_00700 [Anaerolineales bacterium]|nr:hypothetical protein [Anaerolineales bacterium]